LKIKGAIYKESAHKGSSHNTLDQSGVAITDRTQGSLCREAHVAVLRGRGILVL